MRQACRCSYSARYQRICSLDLTDICLSLIKYCETCSHPPVGKVGEAVLHQDGFQHVRIRHSQHGPLELIHAGHSHRHTFIF